MGKTIKKVATKAKPVIKKKATVKAKAPVKASKAPAKGVVKKAMPVGTNEHWWEVEEHHKHPHEQAKWNSGKKSKKVNPEELSSKNRHGHFTKQHIWPLHQENKKGQRF